ncbi:DUF2398 family protein [Terrilactibacillus sp. S3-3]|nr:DUF2398 family protein [Terrilactibacillus sp. S3-3]
MLTLTERRKLYTFFPLAAGHRRYSAAGGVPGAQPPSADPYGRAALTRQEWLSLIQELQQKESRGWSKEYRTMSATRLSENLLDEAERWQFIERQDGQIVILPALLRFSGSYNEDFEGGGDNE